MGSRLIVAVLALTLSGCAFWRLPEQAGQYNIPEEKATVPTEAEHACAHRIIEEEPAWCPEGNNCVRPVVTEEEWAAALARCEGADGRDQG